MLVCGARRVYPDVGEEALNMSSSAIMRWCNRMLQVYILHAHCDVSHHNWVGCNLRTLPTYSITKMTHKASPLRNSSAPVLYVAFL